MDPATHVLTGLMMSRAGFNRVVERASPLLIIAANIPDIDVVTALGGKSFYLDWHRDFTHGAPMAPVMALLPVLAVGLFDRFRGRGAGFPWLKAYLVSLVGVASHLMLDWTNIYGVRLLAPFSQSWFRGDLTGVIDVWIWTALGLAVLWPLLARMVSSEIGARASAWPGSGMARFALLFLLSYNFARWTLHERARAILDARVYDGMVPRQTLALPDFANPLEWRGLVELEGRWREYKIDLGRGGGGADFDPAAGALYYQADPAHPALSPTSRLPSFAVLRRFSPVLLWRVEQLPDESAGWKVTATDLRFGAPRDEAFRATAIVDRAGRATDEGFHFRTDRTPALPR